MKPTIGSVLAESKGVGPGFDFLRIFLAFGVVAFHVTVALGIQGNATPVLWFADYWILLMFFSLSGFLITGSAQRLKLKDFLINRGLRIVPALGVEVIFAAFILGALMTTLPLAEYFHNRQVYHYLTNLFGWINYELPGVFKDHPNQQVNVSLWTVPHEIGCYAVMSGLMVLGLLKRPIVVVLAAAAIAVIGVGLFAAGYRGEHTNPLQSLAYLFFYGRSSRLYMGFLLGIALYLYRDRIPYSWKLFWVSLGIVVSISLLPPSGDKANFPVLNLVASVPLAYLMAFIGASKFPKIPFFHRGDYSYGIYLYGYPVQQVLVQLMPDVKNPLIHLGLAAVLITAFAVFSWHCIEKPIMRLRKKFSFVARQRLEEPEPKPTGEALPSATAKA